MSNDLKSANSVKTGKKFNELRKELNYSVDDIAKSLFINKDYILSIEKGNYSIFPSEAFAKAYFQKYKNFLNIECEFPSIYDEQKEKKYKKIKREIKLPYALNDKTKKLILGSLVITFSAFSFYLINTLNNFEPKAAKLEYELDFESLELMEAALNRNEIVNPPLFENKQINEQLLELKFIGECWIEIYVNNELVEAQQFSDGDIYIKQAFAPFKVVVGNADLVKGTYNGQTIDFKNNINLLNGVSTVNFNND
jgi:cytoskeletal protein RodZ